MSSDDALRRTQNNFSTIFGKTALTLTWGNIRQTQFEVHLFYQILVSTLSGCHDHRWKNTIGKMAQLEQTKEPWIGVNSQALNTVLQLCKILL